MLRTEKGITLVALIITVIVLVILAAVSISAVYQSNIAGITVNGAINYSKASSNEINELESTVNYLNTAIDSISKALEEGHN